MTQEYRFVRPGLVVCLGATPAQALMSKSFRISESRGEWQAGKDGIQTTATYHPAYALRLQGRERRTVEAQMLEDLHIMAARLAEVSREPQPIPQISKRE
jgi:DNA polymerase